MSTIGPDISEGTASVFIWLADKVLGGAKRALGWGWDQIKWAEAQDLYDKKIIEQHGEIRIFGQTTPKPLRDIFTDVYVLDKPSAYRRFDPEKLADHLWEEDRGLPFRVGERKQGELLLNQGTKFFVLGKPGSGKTTFLKRLAVREAQRGKWGACIGKVPIFISLRECAKAGMTLLDFIVDQFAVCHFPDTFPFVRNLLESGRALVLFDGLDEVPSSGEDRKENQRGQVAEKLAKFARVYDACHIIITCRNAATDYTFHPKFTYLEMSDFAPDQVEAFIRNWFWDCAEPDKSVALAEQMLNKLARPEHEGIRDLTRNPLLLTLLCLNYAETLNFPLRRVEIYQEALDGLLKKWDSSRNIQRDSLYGALSLQRKQQMFAHIAYDAYNQGVILFPQTNLEKRLKDHMQYVPELSALINLDAEAILQEIISQHGVFVQQSHGLYSFAHLTFQEYYTAQYIADNINLDTLDTLLNHVTDDKWREVILLTTSLLANATSFMSGFESTLRRLLVPHPQLITYLRWIAAQAAASEAGYRQLATRAFYIYRTGGYFINARNLALDLALNLDFDLAVDYFYDYNRGLVFSHNTSLTFDLDHDISLNPDITRQLAETRDRVLELSQKYGRGSIYKMLSKLEVPSENASFFEWKGFISDYLRVIADQGNYNRYRLLESETGALYEEITISRELDNKTVEALNTYIQASELFYNCLQLAYTSDREAFEDRMFLPSP